MELNFDANTVEPAKPFELLPAGWYKSVIVESEEKPTNAMTGSYLRLTVEIVEGDHEGRKLFPMLNLNNPNPTAVEMAQRDLSAICRAVGVMTPRTSQDLHDKPLMIKVKVRPPKNGYEASNVVDGYEAVNGVSAAPAVASGNGSAVPPWKRK